MNATTLTEKQLLTAMAVTLGVPTDMIERAEALLDDELKPE